MAHSNIITTRCCIFAAIFLWVKWINKTTALASSVPYNWCRTSPILVIDQSWQLHGPPRTYQGCFSWSRVRMILREILRFQKQVDLMCGIPDATLEMEMGPQLNQWLCSSSDRGQTRDQQWFCCIAKDWRFPRYPRHLAQWSLGSFSLHAASIFPWTPTCCFYWCLLWN